MVLECSGKFETPETLQPYFDQAGMKRVMVAQAISGSANNLNMMSAKSAIKSVMFEPPDDPSRADASCSSGWRVSPAPTTCSSVWAFPQVVCCSPPLASSPPWLG